MLCVNDYSVPSETETPGSELLSKSSRDRSEDDELADALPFVELPNPKREPKLNKLDNEKPPLPDIAMPNLLKCWLFWSNFLLVWLLKLLIKFSLALIIWLKQLNKKIKACLIILITYLPEKSLKIKCRLCIRRNAGCFLSISMKKKTLTTASDCN